MEYLFKPIERAFDVFLDLSIRHLGYIIWYKGYSDELNDRVKDLKHKKELVQHGVDDAKNNVKEIEAGAGEWIQKADEKISKIDEIQNDEGHKGTRCSSGMLHYLRHRHRLSRKAKKMSDDVKLHIDNRPKFDELSYQQTPKSVDAISPSDGDFEEFPSRNETIEKIMSKLTDSSVRMIGVHGPGGVGKTTLVKTIAKKALDNKLFDLVATVNITKNPEPLKIQEDIAYNLGLRFEGEGETGRADRLRRRLQNDKENTLLILDDLWDGLDLYKLGIPFDGNYLSQQMRDKGGKDPEKKMVEEKIDALANCRGCKILLTSRIKEVLSDKMEVVEDSVFHIRELEDVEALKLLKTVAEIPDENRKFTPEMVKKYCAGLPVAINIVGRQLRNKSESEWDDILKEVKSQELIGVQKSMESSVKMSYDHLGSEELKSIFLVCALMGHQSFNYGLGEVLFLFGYT